MARKDSRPDTKLVTSGRHPEDNHGVVNPPVYHASTIIFPSVEAVAAAQKDPDNTVRYGRLGTPTTFALEEAIAELDGAYRAVALPSGLAAITCGITGFLETGDHLLVTDSVYAPTRNYCNTVLKRFGVETTFYDPMIGADIERLMRPETKLVFCEAPGSLTFEVQDVPAIAKIAHAHGARVAIDNTWGTSLYYRPLELGADIVIHAATKYIVGHSDAMLGVVSMTEECYRPIRDTFMAFGYSVGPDDIYLGLRGLRTMGVRLRQHETSALEIARWLDARDEVRKVFHPALPSCPGHEIWKRDFSGASGLFSIELGDYPQAAVDAMLNGMELFRLGYSWGGFESLMVNPKPAAIRTAMPWDDRGPLLRLHVGLEDIEDLKADLEAGFERLHAAAR